MEDLDRPREVAGAAEKILLDLHEFGFEWDGEIIHQSHREESYRAALHSLRDRTLTFECSCSRSQLASEERYPGYCRDGPRNLKSSTAVRVRVEPGPIAFADRIQGEIRQDVSAAVGDIIVQRRDRIMAYVLAVTVDDAAQGITHIVRGADLLDDTPRQIYLQQLLGFPLPRYAHVPVLVENDGSKLAKSRSSRHLSRGTVQAQLIKVMKLLGLEPPPVLQTEPISEVWRWAIHHWSIERVPKRLTLRSSS